jgi:hypothetical protein
MKTVRIRCMKYMRRTQQQKRYAHLSLSLYTVSTQNRFNNLVQLDKSRVYNKIWSQTRLAYDTKYLYGIKDSMNSFESNPFNWNFFDNGETPTYQIQQKQMQQTTQSDLYHWWSIIFVWKTLYIKQTYMNKISNKIGHNFQIGSEKYI